jgi:PiT family inorganic phosphate transporter
MFTLLIVVIVLALLFDLVNGFHDAANSIATVVSTKVLSPLQAVIWAAGFNVLAFWVFDMSVGNTVAKTVDSNAIDLWVILAGLLAATIWNLFTWWLGIPSSSSHTLIGGFAGAAVAHGGFDVIDSSGILVIVLFIFLSPLIGGIIAFIIALITISRRFFLKFLIIVGGSLGIYFLMDYMVEYLDMTKEMMWIVVGMLAIFIFAYIYYMLVYGKRQTALKESNMYKRLQLLSSAAFSLGHGGADSQKVMGIICAALLVYGNMSREGLIKEEIPKEFQISEMIQIEYKNEDGKKQKFKPKDINVYVKGDGFYDADTKEPIFINNTLQENYTKASVFSNVVEENHLKEGYKIKTKVVSKTMPFWISFGCYLMISIGTLFGGWKIVKTMGTKITKVSALEGVCAETAGALTLFVVSNLGIPVSTTHTITGSIIGVGATKRLSAVRWGVTINLLWAWVLTIPVSAILAMVLYYIIGFFH